MNTEYNLIEGKVFINHEIIKPTNSSFWDSIKWKFLSIVGVLYIYDRILVKFEENTENVYLIITTIYYGVLLIFILFSIYYYWIKTSWTNSLKIENITKLSINKDEDSPLNINILLKGKFSTLLLSFRETENDYKNFIKELRSKNSRFKINDER